jgi:ribosomal protein S28E/S33
LLDPEDEGTTILRNVKTLLDPEDEGPTFLRKVKTLLDPEDEGSTILRNVTKGKGISVSLKCKQL